MNDYKSISSEVKAELIIKKSKFIACVKLVLNEREAKEFLFELK